MAKLCSYAVQRAGADFDEKCAAQRLALSECASLAVGAAHTVTGDHSRLDTCNSMPQTLQ